MCKWRGRQAEKERERIPHSLPAVSAGLDTGLHLTDHEPVSRVGCLTDCAPGHPLQRLINNFLPRWLEGQRCRPRAQASRRLKRDSTSESTCAFRDKYHTCPFIPVLGARISEGSKGLFPHVPFPVMALARPLAVVTLHPRAGGGFPTSWSQWG